MSTGDSERPYAGDDEPLVGPASSEPPADREPEVGAPSPGAPSSSPATSDPAVGSGALEPASRGSDDEAARARHNSTNMLPQDRRRSPVERLLVRLIATCGIVGIGVAIAAIMVSSKSQGWIVGLVVSIVSVILAALLWSSRML